MAWTAHFYEDANGACPARDFLDGLSAKKRARMAAHVQAVEQNGWQLGGGKFEACSGYGDVQEIRAKFSDDLLRIYCYVDKDELILLSGLDKPERTPTPRNVFEQAAQYANDYKTNKRTAPYDDEVDAERMPE